MSRRILMPLPVSGFDPTEAAVSWRILLGCGIEVAFATPDGQQSQGADPWMLTGEGLDAWSRVPGLKGAKLLGLILRANASARQDYARMTADLRYRNPCRYSALDSIQFDGLLLPGGHCAAGMQAYLENSALQSQVANFFDRGLPVGAICHGVVLAARSMSARTGKSVLYGRKTTALTWTLERSAWRLTRRWCGDYYRTYVEQPAEPEGYRSVEAEVTRSLADPKDFLDAAGFRQTTGLFRDSDADESPAFVVVDGGYVSARWPGDVHAFAKRFAKLVE